MALTATMRRFEIELADSDRGVYEALDLRVAQHPSESDRYLVARVLARVLEHGEGVAFSKGGVSDDSEPALTQRDLRGDLQAWIEIGAPTPDRLHRAMKASPRVAVYAWKSPEQLARDVVEAKVYKVEALEIFALDPELLDAIAATLDRNNKWSLSVTGGALYLDVGGRTFEGSAARVLISS